jgi:hypothetical protein
MRSTRLLVFAIAAAFAVPLAAQTSSGGFTGGTAPGGTTAAPAAGAAAAESFEALDKDKDGFISHYEAKDSAFAQRLREFDKDRDGKLSREEFAALLAALGSGAAGQSGAGAKK